MIGCDYPLSTSVELMAQSAGERGPLPAINYENGSSEGCVQEEGGDRSTTAPMTSDFELLTCAIR
jgi:hypothetical protein